MMAIVLLSPMTRLTVYAAVTLVVQQIESAAPWNT